MRIRGEIVRKRLYTKSSSQENYLLFIKVVEGVMIRGIRIYTIPVLGSTEILNYQLGDCIEITGRIQYQQIITPSGYRSLTPIPVMIPVAS